MAGGLQGDNPLSADGAGDRDRADRAEAAARADFELVDESFPARLDVEEASVGGDRRVDGAACVAVLPSRVRPPSSASWKRLSEPLPALEVKKKPPVPTTQQVAAWPVPTASSFVTVPSALSVKLASALVPASATSRRPWSSKATAKGTSPGSELTTGLAESRPRGLIRNTSMALPLPLVVTSSWRPSGEKAT